MKRFSGPEEIYDELVEKSDQNWLLGLVAFAVIEEQRIEWYKHQQVHNQQVPTDDEVKAWYAQQPEGVLLRARDTAEARLQDYSQQTLDALEAGIREEILQGKIISEIKDIKKFGPQFKVSFFAGLASAILFSLMLTLVAVIALNDNFATSIATKVSNKLEVKNEEQ